MYRGRNKNALLFALKLGLIGFVFWGEVKVRYIILEHREHLVGNRNSRPISLRRLTFLRNGILKIGGNLGFFRFFSDFGGKSLFLG